MPKKIDRTAAQRQRARRERLAKAGFHQRQIFVHDEDWPRICELVQQLNNCRLSES